MLIYYKINDFFIYIYISTIFEKRIHIWFKQKCSDFHQIMQNAILCPTFNKKCNKCTMFIEGGSLIL